MPLDAGPALAALLATTPFLNADEHRMDRLIDTLEFIVSAVPSYTLTFHPKSALELLDALAAQPTVAS